MTVYNNYKHIWKIILQNTVHRTWRQSRTLKNQEEGFPVRVLTSSRLRLMSDRRQKSLEGSLPFRHEDSFPLYPRVNVGCCNSTRRAVGRQYHHPPFSALSILLGLGREGSSRKSIVWWYLFPIIFSIVNFS